MHSLFSGGSKLKLIAFGPTVDAQLVKRKYGTNIGAHLRLGRTALLCVRVNTPTTFAVETHLRITLLMKGRWLGPSHK